MSRIQPAAEQAAHPTSGPRRRPRELSGSFMTHGGFQEDDSHKLLSDNPGAIQPRVGCRSCVITHGGAERLKGETERGRQHRTVEAMAVEPSLLGADSLKNGLESALEIFFGDHQHP